jgi:hypothetical protein
LVVVLKKLVLEKEYPFLSRRVAMEWTTPAGVPRTRRKRPKQVLMFSTARSLFFTKRMRIPIHLKNC